MLVKIRLRRDAEGMILKDDSGAALLLALILLIGIALFLASILTFASTGFLTTQAVRGQGASTYADDAGVKGAINYLAKHPEFGTSTGICPTYTVSDVNSTPVTVTCAPYLGSGIPIGGNNVTNTPEYALLTVTTTSNSNGLDMSNGNLHVQGSVFSNSSLNFGGSSSLSVSPGFIATRGTCSGTVSPPCSITTTVEDDPQYPPATTSFVTGTVVCAAGIATFTPGKYIQDPEYLLGHTLGCSTSNTRLFPPGVPVGAYYFESVNWNMDGVNQVGFDAGGGCTVGAQLLFGGSSNVFIKQGANLQICAYKPTTGQQIGIYGAGSVARLRPTSAITTGTVTTPFTPLSASTVNNFDGILTTATFTGNNQSQFLGTTGYSQGWNGSSFAASGNISSATLRISHKDSETNASRFRVSATVAPADGSAPLTVVSGSNCSGVPAPCINSALTLNATLHEDVIDLKASPPSWTLPTRFNGATITFAAFTTSGSGTFPKTESLDGIWLDVVYAPPNLLAMTPGLQLLHTHNSADVTLKITGTFYAPATTADLNLGNNCDQTLARGAIVWSMTMKLTGSCNSTNTPISIPGSSSGTPTDRTVLLTAYVGCSPPSAGCTPKLRAKVRFLTDGTTVIDQWSVLRS